MESATKLTHDAVFPPGPRSSSVRQFLTFLTGQGFEKDQLLDDIQGWFDDYGDVVGMNFMGQNTVFTCHPDHIYDLLLRKHDSFHKGPDYKNEKWGLAAFLGNGLIVSDGEFWRRQRKLVQPALSPRHIESYADTMVAYTDRMVNTWQDGELLAFDQLMSALTMQIVAKCLLNEDVSSVVTQISAAMDILQEVATEPSPLPQWLPTARNRSKGAAIRDLDQIVYGFIDRWREQRIDRGDLLSMLMLATDDEGDSMSVRQARDELVTLLLAGHETTANALNWTFFLLSGHPEVEARLHDEVDRVLGDRLPTLAHLDDLAYTRAVIEEAMRLYPPAWSFSRQAIEEVEIGGYPIKKGTVVGTIVYSVHRDPRWWPEPLQFRPERFLDGDPERPKFAYIPFGGGPRICIGNHFAMMEAQLIVATICRRFRLRLPAGQEVVPKPLITLVPKDGLPLRAEQRRNKKDR